MKTVDSEDPLSIWMSDEQSALDALGAGIGAGVCAPTDIGTRTGLQVMHAMMRGELPYASCARTNKFCAVDARPGVAIFQGTPSGEQLNPMGTVNGGWISTIMDSAMGSAVLTTLDAGTGYFTVDLQVQYLKVLTMATRRVRAVAEVTETEEKSVRAKAVLVGPDGKVFAEATSTCRLVGGRPSAKS